MIKEIENLKLEDLLTNNLVESKVQLKDRNEVIERIGQLMYNAGKIKKNTLKLCQM